MKQSVFSLLLLLASAFICSCSKDEVPQKDDGLEEKVYTLNLNVTHLTFDNTKGDEYQWPNGAKLYIMFSNKAGTNEYAGTATYNSTTKTWSIPAPQGELHRGDSTACKVVYINKKGPKTFLMSIQFYKPCSVLGNNLSTITRLNIHSYSTLASTAFF